MSDYASSAELNLAAQQAIGAVEPAIRDDSSFGGMEISPEGVLVFVVDPPSETVQNAIESMQEKVTVITRPAANSMSELDNMVDQLNKDAPLLMRRGVPLSTWGISLDTNKVEVMLSSYTDVARSQLLDRYGSQLLTVSMTSGGALPN